MSIKHTAPVTVGRDYEFSIDDLGSHGEGVGRYDGFTVFVPDALPGETVRATITTVKKHYAAAELAAILTPSAERVTPPSGRYADCGVYPLMHWAYPAQLAWKRRRVEELLTRIGNITVPVEPVIGMTEPLHYRNKMQLPAGYVDGRPALGFYARGSHRIIDMEHCLLQDEPTNRLLAAVREIVLKYDVAPYDETTGEGVLRHVIGRTGRHGLMAILVTATKKLPQKDMWVRELRLRLPELESLWHNVQPRRTNIILGREMHHVWGAKKLLVALGGLEFHLSPGSFWQVNSVQTEVLYRTVLEAAALTGKETVIDAYCGVGAISLFLARAAARVIGVEIVAPAISDAKENARHNGVENAEFIAADTADHLPLLAAQGVSPDVIVMDPARAGCDEKVLAAVVAMQPERIVYVSCNPATLVRDMAYLVRKGYAPRRVRPVDMFPHTPHVETVALMVHES